MSWLNNLLKKIEAEVRPVFAPVAAAALPALEADVAEAIADQHLEVLKKVSAGLDKAGVPAPVSAVAMDLIGSALDKVVVKILPTEFKSAPDVQEPLGAPIEPPVVIAAPTDAEDHEVSLPPEGAEITSPPLAQAGGGSAV